MAFTANQKAQVDRLPAAYFKAPIGKAMTDEEFKAMMSNKLEALTPDQIRARVNITGISWGTEIVVNFSAENDYTDDQKQAIQAGMRQGDKMVNRAAEIVAAGPSIEQRVATLEGG